MVCGERVFELDGFVGLAACAGRDFFSQDCSSLFRCKILLCYKSCSKKKPMILKVRRNHWLALRFKPANHAAYVIRAASIPSKACHNILAVSSAASSAAWAASGFAASRFSNCLRHTFE